MPEMQRGPDSAAGVREGDVLAGKYRVERVLGIGGMGVVVAAQHLQLDMKVAIKFLLPGMLANQEVVGRFAREARAAVRITSEHVVRVLDVGTLDTGAPYMVMEYLEGGDLATWLNERGPLPIDQAVEFVLQACIAVADAHGLGIVHRDLKPANLFCIRRSDGHLVVKVLDFGISKITDASRASEPHGLSVTKLSSVLGSPYYMSPEQVQSARDVDTRTDLWSLGVILFELLTRTVPFQAEAFGELAVKIAVEAAPSLRRYRPEAPAALEAVILKCLEKDRHRRYLNVAELAMDLLPFAPRRAKASVERIRAIIKAAGLSASALNLPPSPQPEKQAASGSLSPLGRTTDGPTSRKAAVVLSGVFGAGALVALVGSAVLSQRAPAHHDPPAAAAPIASPVVTLIDPANGADANVLEAAVASSATPPLAHSETPRKPVLGQASPSAQAAPSPAATSSTGDKTRAPRPLPMGYKNEVPY
jgi:serine/threonine protein kinase